MKPKRVISLVPSATEIVCALGCADRLVGRSHECDYPPEIRALPACSRARMDSAAPSADIDREIRSLSGAGQSLYEVDAAALRSLRPQVVLTQGLCDVCAVSPADVQKALGPGDPAQIVPLAASHVADLWKEIAQVADAIGAGPQGRELLDKLKNRVVDVIQKTCVFSKRRTVACLEWLDPLMAAGNWMPELVDFAGGANLFGEPGKHSPWLEWPALTAKDPDVLVLMPCGFDLDRTRREAAALASRPEWRNLRAVKSGQVFIVDGNQYFNRPGPRLVDSLEILTELLHPKLFTFGYEGKAWTRL